MYGAAIECTFTATGPVYCNNVWYLGSLENDRLYSKLVPLCIIPHYSTCIMIMIFSPMLMIAKFHISVTLYVL